MRILHKIKYILIFGLMTGTSVAAETPLNEGIRFCVLVTTSVPESTRSRKRSNGFLLKAGEKKYLIHESNVEHQWGGKIICENKSGVVLQFPVNLVVDENSRKSLDGFPLVAYELMAIPLVDEHFSFAVLDDGFNSGEKPVACAIIESEKLHRNGLPVVFVPVRAWGRAEENSHFGYGERCFVVQPVGVPMYSPVVENHKGQYVISGILFELLRSSERLEAGQVMLSPKTLKRLLAESTENK